jgi:hypothetical protein
MGVNITVLPLPLPNRQRRPKKWKRVYYGLPERRPRHHSGHNCTTIAMDLSPNKRCTGMSGSCHGRL